MAKKITQLDLELSDKRGLDSKSKQPLKLGSSEFIYKNKKDEKANDNLFIDDDAKNAENGNNYWYRGELMTLVPDALSEILEAKEVVVEQKIELMEVLTGCETPNRYNVYLLDKNKQKKFLFKCKEESNWFCRNCVPSDSRSFFLKMMHIISSNKKTDYKKIIADFDRPFKFTCLCCCRPIMDGFFNGENNKNNEQKLHKKMGTVLESFSLGPKMLIYGENNQIKWKIYADYCQCGFWARDISVGKCYEVDFWIYEANADIKSNKPVGNIHKVFKGLSELVTDSDAFILTFPKNATAIERLMLIGSVIMIDYRYYEDLACCDCISIL